MSTTGVCNSINLKGSVKIISEFFNYAVNNILFQRGIYPSDTFTPVQNYGLTILMSTDSKVKSYLKSILDQLQELLVGRKVHRIVLVIVKLDTKETIERWEFKVDCDHEIKDEQNVEVDLKEIQNGICAVVRQIIATITFLPQLDDAVSFDILFFADKDIQLPSADWADTTAHLIPNAEEVQLRSFNTKIHNLKASVAYKQTE